MYDQRHAEFVSAYNAGVPMSRIARSLRISENTARKWRDMHKLPDRKARIIHGKTLPAAAIAFIREHYHAPGWTAKTIGKALGISKNMVIGKANRMGLGKTREGPTHLWGMPIAPPRSRCQWIEGEVTASADFHYCGKPVMEGQSYCRGHTERAVSPATWERLNEREAVEAV